MTDKQDFIDKLRAALEKRSVSENDMRLYIEQFDSFYDRLTEESARIPDSPDGIEKIADSIAAQISERNEEINRFAEQTMTVDAIDVSAVSVSDLQPEIDSEPTVTTDIAPITEAADEYGLDDEAALLPIIPDELQGGIGDDSVTDSKEGTSRLPDYVEKEIIPNSKVFWIIFAAALPITVPLFLVIVGVFAIVWASIMALMAGSLAAMVAVSAVGAILALVGIISGIIQLFSVVPIGVYEIGMGVACGGAAMLAGILLYNFAVRLMPFLIRKVWVLFRFVMRKLKVLFNFLRKECAKL